MKSTNSKLTAKLISFSNLCLVGAALVGAFSLIGCTKENSDNVAIAAGLSCLDNATNTAQADACQGKVAGINSAQAYQIRCSANLIAQGFTGSRISTAYQQLKTPATGTNATATMLSYFVFNPALTNDTATITNTNCTASGDAALTGIGNLVNTASVIAALYAKTNYSGTLAGSPLDPSSASFNPAQLQSAISLAYTSNDPTTNAAVGQMAISAQANYCGTGSALASQSICTQLSTAVTNGGGDPGNTGFSLLNLLQSATH